MRIWAYLHYFHIAPHVMVKLSWSCHLAQRPRSLPSLQHLGRSQFSAKLSVGISVNRVPARVRDS